MSEEGDTPISTKLAGCYSDLSIADLDESIRDRTILRVIDVLGQAYAGVGERHHRTVLTLGAGERAHESARVIGTAQSWPVEMAAFANAMTAHTLVGDDAHRSSGAHPGAVVVPTAMAAGEAENATGETVLGAILAGYDAIGRLGKLQSAFTADIPRRPTPVFGPIGAAVTAGIIQDLGARELANAMNLAANTAGGFSQVWHAGTDEYVFHSGTAARNGLFAARLASAGFETAPDTFEGEHGFYRALYGGVPADSSQPVSKLGQRFELDDVYSKPVPACGLAITPIQIAEHLSSDGINTEDIERVSITVSKRALSIPGTAFAGPFETPTQALMSIPFGVASALHLGQYSRRACTEYLDDPDVRAILETIELTPTDSFSKYQCKIAVDRVDGTTISRELTAPDLPTAAELRTAFLDSASAVLGRRPARDLLAELERLHESEDVSRIAPLL